MRRFRELRIAHDLLKRIDTAAEEMGITTTALVEGLLERYLLRRDAKSRDDADRRAFERHPIRLPGVVYVTEPDGHYGRYQPVELYDISLNGVGFRMPPNSELDVRLADGEFEVIFRLDDSNPPVRMRCRSSRNERGKGATRVGAAFIGGDSGSHALMERYFVQ